MKRAPLTAIIVLTILTAFFLCTGVAQAGYVTTEIVSSNDSVSYPQINNSGQITWLGFVRGIYPEPDDDEVFLYSGGVITRITDNWEFDLEPQLNDLGHIAWGSWNTYADVNAWLYSGGSITQLSWYSTYYESGPEINNLGQVVFGGSGSEGSHIYLCCAGGTIPIPGSQDGVGYGINDSSQVVWSGPDGTDSEIMLYSGGTTTPITNNSYNDDTPEINNSGQIVWYGYDGNDSEIFLYSGGVITQLTNNSYNDYGPKINNLGQVVWRGLEGADYELFRYSGGSTTQLTSNSYDETIFYEINDSGQVVWECTDGTDDEIYLYSGGSTIQLTNNSYYDGQPQINNSGQVVWSRGWDGSTFKIYRADHCIEGKPALNLSIDPTSPTVDPDATPDGIYWASYTDYLAGLLSINYRVTNSGSEPAYAVELTGSTATNGVSLNTVTPVTLGAIGAGSYATTTLKYNVPSGTGSFMATVNATAQDACGNSYTYP